VFRQPAFSGPDAEEFFNRAVIDYFCINRLPALTGTGNVFVFRGPPPAASPNGSVHWPPIIREVEEA
jgi:hypothetical protein